ncbi:MAG TPA: LysM peptidoglycan-binding domain-containing protein [Solirubrobacteraceae bacterium]|nr:LysM peptidoglycan-binding domain-containing protein [Solirubrobacteraceae bacterium]
MRTWKSLVLTLTLAAVAWAPATASAAFEHIVAKGETLSSVAAADGLSISQLAAANGMSPESQLILGSSLAIPPQNAAGESAVSSPATSAASEGTAEPEASSGGLVVQRGETLSAIASQLGMTVDSLAAANGLDPSGLLIAGTVLHSTGGSDSSSAGATDSAAPVASSGGFVVQRGDTLSAIAARLGVTVDALAAANGLDPSGLLISGTTLHAVGGGSTSTAPATTEMVSTTTSPSSGGGAQPTAEMVSPETVGSIAAGEGVPSSLAEAVGYQESGFNNGMVSNTGAVGVMQIMPSTWDWIGQHLAGPPPLSTTSATDNIRAGSLLLHSLLSDTGGNDAEAIAGYYQGLGSVEAHGMYSDTRAYVNNVMALQQRFGGG